jgi:hypothetical protein
MNKHVEKQVEACRKAVEDIKNALEKETYK